MYQPYSINSNVTVSLGAAGPYPSAAQSAGYPAQPQQQVQQQLPHQSLYPDMKPLADDTHIQQPQPQQQQQQVPSALPLQQDYANAPAGDPYTQPYLQPQQQQQQQQPYPGVGQQLYQHQQQGYGYHTAGLADDMQKLNVQQGLTASGSGVYPQQGYAQQQPQLQQPYAQPYVQQQQQQPYAQPNTQQQQQQQQQPYPQAVPQNVPLPYQHSGSGNSSQYGSFHSQQYSSSLGSQQQQQQQQQLHHGGGGSGSYPYPYPNSPHQQQQQYGSAPGQQYGSGNSQHYGSYNGHQHGSFGASSFNSSAVDMQQPSRYPSMLESGSFGSQHLPHQQQQQQSAPLPPYPAVPQPVPVMPYNVAPEKVSHGYDVMFYIQNAKNLPSMDWWNGLADPYVIITAHVGGQQFHYKTAHKRNTVNPEFDNEFFQIGNLPSGTAFFVEVWDKDVVTDDDVIGRTSWSFSPQEMLQASTAGGGLLSEDHSWGRLVVKLPLKHPSKTSKKAGEIELEVCYRPSTHVAPPRMLGPVRFRQHLSPSAGLFTGHWWSDADIGCYMTYKFFLTNIPNVFDHVRMPWNRKYDKAVSIFKNPVVLGGIRTQHSALYSTHRGGNSRGGVLSTAADFFKIFNNGMRGGERRFFTYVLCEDSLRCSETGAAFFNDMFSKHAMHSGGAEEVLYAGEFCIFPCPGAAGGHKLIIDNNSGTYAPDKSKLPLMQQLFKANFSDMTVEVLDMKDPRLVEYQKACPSRLSLPQ